MSLSFVKSLNQQEEMKSVGSRLARRAGRIAAASVEPDGAVRPGCGSERHRLDHAERVIAPVIAIEPDRRLRLKPLPQRKRDTHLGLAAP